MNALGATSGATCYRYRNGPLATCSLPKRSSAAPAALSLRPIGTGMRELRPVQHRHDSRTKHCKPTTATLEAIIPKLDRDDEKEDSRKYRRTVFTFDNWAAHRSVKRYPRHILTLFTSRIARGLIQPVGWFMGLAAAIAAYETARETGYIDAATFPDLTFQLSTPFSSTSFALSLLLVFRTNTSFSRWQEARVLWGGITNRSRDIVRQAVTFIPAEQDELVEMYKRWSMAFSKVLSCHLREADDPRERLADVLLPDELDKLMQSAHRPNYVLQVLSELIANSSIISPERFRMDQNLTFFADALGACERILKTPIPLSYTRHTSRFLVIWLTAMPFTLWKTCGWSMIPASGMIAFLLLGIEEIGVQIEEPFSILPLEKMADTIQQNCLEMKKNSSTVKKLVAPTLANAHHAHNGSNGKQDETEFLRTASDPRDALVTSGAGR